MKKQIAFLLIASTLASVLSLVSCKQKSTTPENPFDVGAVTSAVSGQSNADSVPPNPNWSQSEVTGEKILYGKKNYVYPNNLKIGNRMTSVMRFGDMLIGEVAMENKLGYYSFEDPSNARFLCFDPLCLHFFQQDTCPAIFNYYQKVEHVGAEIEVTSDPMGMFIDRYENTESPVIYMYYRRSEYFSINLMTEEKREALYCIERYDMAKDKRTVVLDNEKNTITQVCTYGDYIYYVLDCGKKGQMIYRILKSGGEPECFDLEEEAESIFIVDVVDDKLYYVFDEQELYCSDLDLTDNKKVLELSSLKGKDGTVGVMQGSYSGYLYYIADVETVWAGEPEESPSSEKANLYRVPVNDLTKAPEMVVEGMNIGRNAYMFSEKTFYYTLCVQTFDDTEGGETAVNTCDGKMYALNLSTGESKLIVENSGMTIYPLLAWDDRVIFSGWAYNSTGKEYSEKNTNLLIAYVENKPFEIWCEKGDMGKVNEEYLKLNSEAIKAAIDKLEDE